MRVYRDIAALQAQGLPIEGAAGIGYAVRGKLDLPPLTFGNDELEALALGLAFPILFPIALFAVVIQYIVERYTLAIVYRLPPKFSLDLTTWNIHILMNAPL